MDYPASNIQLYERLRAHGWGEPAMARAQAGYHLAALHFAARYRPDGRTFVEHLVRTAGILLEDGAPEPVVLAGLVHAHYTQGDFGGGPRGRSTANRRKLTAAVGEEAEAVVAAYSAFRWSERSIREMIERLEGHGRPLVDVEREVLVIRVANELEEGLDNSLVYCRPGMRDDTLKKLALSAALARLLARDGLAERIDAVVKDYGATGLDHGWGGAPPVRARDGSYELLPPSASLRPAARLRRLAAGARAAVRSARQGLRH